MPSPRQNVGFFDVLYSQMLRGSIATTRESSERTKELTITRRKGEKNMTS